MIAASEMAFSAMLVAKGIDPVNVKQVFESETQLIVGPQPHSYWMTLRTKEGEEFTLRNLCEKEVNMLELGEVRNFKFEPKVV